MNDPSAPPVRLYLPLLTHPDPEVRRQACVILLGTYGDRVMTVLRRMLEDPEIGARQGARLGLLAIAETTGAGVRLVPPRGLYVACLGALRVFVGSRELGPDDWARIDGGRAGWQKVQSVFAYLMHCGQRGASRLAIGAAVWGGPVSPGSLTRTLSALRQVLGDHAPGVLVEDAEHALLDPRQYHSDAQLFERAYATAERMEREQGLASAVPLYQQALQLYGGPYMADVTRGSGWWRARRDALVGNFLATAERLAEQAFAQHQYQQCIAVCTLALDADPAADRSLVWLLRALHARGSFAELEHAYRTYLHALDRRSSAGDMPREHVTRVYEELSPRRNGSHP